LAVVAPLMHQHLEVWPASQLVELSELLLNKAEDLCLVAVELLTLNKVAQLLVVLVAVLPNNLQVLRSGHNPRPRVVPAPLLFHLGVDKE